MKNKKKILAIVLMGLLVLTLVPAAVFAGYGSQQGQGIGYVDANGDGICDNHGSACGNYVDANGDGICDNHGSACGNYVDTNGDGICDNHGSACGNYVDANGDGVCDNAGTVNTGHHSGRGMGHHGGGHHGGRW